MMLFNGELAPTNRGDIIRSIVELHTIDKTSWNNIQWNYLEI